MPNKDKTSLEQLKDDIDKIKRYNKENSTSDDKTETNDNAATAFRVGLELFSGVAAGSMLGYFLDKWLNTFPLFFVICFTLGATGGMLNIYRLMKDS